MRTAVTKHLDEGTLLRLAARDLGEPEALAAETHLAKCAACRTGLAASRRLDRSLAKLAEARRSDESRGDFGPDARYFEFVSRLLDVSGEAEEAAERIVRAARVAGRDELAAALRSLEGKPHRGFALLYAAQKADKLVAEDPNKALTLARLLSEEAATLQRANTKERVSTPAPRQGVQAEAALLESQALLQKGEAGAAREAIKPAREFFRESRDLGFGAARCDYHEGTAATFAKDYPEAQRLLKHALAVFSGFGQEHWAARAHAGLGTLFGQQGQHELALEYFDASPLAFESESETGSKRTTMLLNNKATALMRLGRFDEARSTFAKALSFGRRHKHASHLFFIRTGLAELDFCRGEYHRALRAFAEIVNEASPLASQLQIMLARLYVAECHARLGSYGPMATEIEALRRERQANRFAPSPALSELFMSLDQGAIDADLIVHVREYLQDEANGVRRTYRPLRRAGSPRT
jgi:tetratricopeptide (TPR) repeat protein